MVPLLYSVLNRSEALLHAFQVFVGDVRVSVGTSQPSVAVPSDEKGAHVGFVSLKYFVAGAAHRERHLCKLLFKLWVLKREDQLVYLSIDIIRPVVFVGLLFGHYKHLALINILVSQFNWEAVVQVK
jgi:hypothetical protein